MTQPTYTPSELLAPEQEQRDFPLIRELAGEVLNPRPWRHEDVLDFPHGCNSIDTSDQVWLCEKCGAVFGKLVIEQDMDRYNAWLDGPCPGPHSAEGSLPDITERLVKKIAYEPSDMDSFEPLYEAVTEICPLAWASENLYAMVGRWMWFGLGATAAQRAVCCLMSLLPEQVKVTQ